MGKLSGCFFFMSGCSTLLRPLILESRLPPSTKSMRRERNLEYGRRVHEVEQASFTPLVFTANSGMAPEATVTFKRLASLLADKRDETYGSVMGWLRCEIAFNLLRSALVCIRGNRSKPSDRSQESTMTEAIIDGRVPKY